MLPTVEATLNLLKSYLNPSLAEPEGVNVGFQGLGARSV